MARLTLRLPDSLHQNLRSQAQDEGISLNQFIVYQLTRASTASEVAADTQQGCRNTFLAIPGHL